MIDDFVGSMASSKLTIDDLHEGNVGFVWSNETNRALKLVVIDSDLVC